MSTLHAFEFLGEPSLADASPMVVLVGDDRFLHLLVRPRLLDQVAALNWVSDQARVVSSRPFP